MSKQLFILVNEAVRERAINWLLKMPLGMVVEFREVTRTVAQNAALWPALQDMSKQIDWAGKMRTREQWKDLFTANLFKGEMVPNFDGDGVVMLGVKTSTLSKKDFCELLDFIYAFGALRGVEFSRDKSGLILAYENMLKKAA